jgi:hypothetical protein
MMGDGGPTPLDPIEPCQDIEIPSRDASSLAVEMVIEVRGGEGRAGLHGQR